MLDAWHKPAMLQVQRIRFGIRFGIRMPIKMANEVKQMLQSPRVPGIPLSAQVPARRMRAVLNLPIVVHPVAYHDRSCLEKQLVNTYVKPASLCKALLAAGTAEWQQILEAQQSTQQASSCPQVQPVA